MIGWMIIILGMLLAFVIMLLTKRASGYQQTQAEQEEKINEVLKKGRGFAGEFHMHQIVKEVSGEKLILTNCYLPTMNHHTTEVDLIMLHEKGIFVFECKNRGGKIIGDEFDQDWTQVLTRNNGEVLHHHFYNPMRQNQTHMNALAHYLNCSTHHFHSFIVFDADAHFSENLLEDKTHVVTTLFHLSSELENYLEELPSVYSKGELKRMHTRLMTTCNVSDKVKENHKHEVNKKDIFVDDEIKQKYLVKEEVKEDVKYCPKCGGKLIEARIDHGEHKGKLFLKCQNFPKCLYAEMKEEGK